MEPKQFAAESQSTAEMLGAGESPLAEFWRNEGGEEDVAAGVQEGQQEGPQEVPPETPSAGAEDQGAAKVEQGESEGEGEGPAPEAPAPESNPLVEVLARRFPNRVIETPEDAEAVLNEIVETYEGFQALSESLPEEVFGFLEAVAEGKDIREAFNVLKPLLEQPDPQEDPEGYARWLLEQERRKEELKRQQEEREREVALLRAREEYLTQLKDRFVQETGLDEETLEAFGNRLVALLQGDPETGRIPGYFYHALYTGLEIGPLFRQAVQAGVSASELLQAMKSAVAQAMAQARGQKQPQTSREGKRLPNLNQAGRSTTPQRRGPVSDVDALDWWVERNRENNILDLL